MQSVLSRLPKPATVIAKADSLDKWLTPLYGSVMAYLLYTLGMSFYSAYPTTDAGIFYLTQIYTGFSLIAVVFLGLSFFESLRRNELGDTVRVIVAVILCFVATRVSGSYTIIAIAYGFGFAFVHGASRHGKLDWTPMVAFNAAYVWVAVSAFGASAVSVILPVMLTVVFEVAEVLRNRDYRAVRLALPGFAVALFGIVVTMSPTYWVIAGAVISFGVIPTVVRLVANSRKEWADWLKTSESPCSEWQNGMKNLTVSLESAMLTLAASMLMLIAAVVFGA